MIKSLMDRKRFLKFCTSAAALSALPSACFVNYGLPESKYKLLDKPLPLKKGDKIALVAPAYSQPPEKNMQIALK